jgi:hypothetical protein
MVLLKSPPQQSQDGMRLFLGMVLYRYSSRGQVVSHGFEGWLVCSAVEHEHHFPASKISCAFPFRTWGAIPDIRCSHIWHPSENDSLFSSATIEYCIASCSCTKFIDPQPFCPPGDSDNGKIPDRATTDTSETRVPSTACRAETPCHLRSRIYGT